MRLALGCSRDPFSLCALCPLSVLCYLFWCSNLCQVNNILCSLKLCVGNKKGLLPLLKVPVCDFSCSLRLPDRVIIRCCFLPAITFGYNGSNTRKAKGVAGRQGQMDYRRGTVQVPQALINTYAAQRLAVVSSISVNASDVISLEYIWTTSLPSYRSHIVSSQKGHLLLLALFVLRGRKGGAMSLSFRIARVLLHTIPLKCMFQWDDLLC